MKILLFTLLNYQKDIEYDLYNYGFFEGIFQYIPALLIIAAFIGLVFLFDYVKNKFKKNK